MKFSVFFGWLVDVRRPVVIVRRLVLNVRQLTSKCGGGERQLVINAPPPPLSKQRPVSVTVERGAEGRVG